MIKQAIILLPFCLLITAKQETHEIPWALADMAMDVNQEPLEYNFETETDKIDEEMFDLLVASHPYHSQDRRKIKDKIRNNKKIWKPKNPKPHRLPSF